MDIVSNRHSTLTKFGVVTQMNLQFQILARLHNKYNIPRENMKVHPNFKFTLETRLNWSKNCNEECGTPWQNVLFSYVSFFECSFLWHSG